MLLPLIFPSIGDFSNKSVLPIKWRKYWRLNFSLSPSNEYSGFIFFRVDRMDLLSFQGILKSLVQYHSYKSMNALVLSFLYDPTLTSITTSGKTIALTIQTFAGKAISLLFSMLSRFFIALSSKDQHLFFSQLQSLSLVILEPRIINLSLFSLFLHAFSMK